jgi:hypothetical protein
MSLNFKREVVAAVNFTYSGLQPKASQSEYSSSDVRGYIQVLRINVCMCCLMYMLIMAMNMLLYLNLSLFRV